MNEDDYSEDLLYHALIYRGVIVDAAQAQYEALEACVERKIARAVAAERERCASICEGIGAMGALEGEEAGSAAMVRVADRQTALCAEAIRKGPQ